MSDGSPIEWTDATWNPVTGCTQIPGVKGRPSGCDNCYAKRQIDVRFSKNPTNVRFGTKFEQVMLHEDRLEIPLHWRKPRKVFVNSLSDLFHDEVPDEFITRVFGTMFSAYWHVFQVLTKRPEQMRRLVRKIYAGAALPMWYPQVRDGHLANVWLGVSVSTRDDLWRIDMLRETPAAVRFLSIEPLLGDVGDLNLDGIHWIIVGGESGPGAREMHPDWARSVRDQCVAAGVAFHFKQWGEWLPVSERKIEDMCGFVSYERVGKKRAGRELDGRTWDEFPKAVA